MGGGEAKQGGGEAKQGGAMRGKERKEGQQEREATFSEHLHMLLPIPSLPPRRTRVAKTIASCGGIMHQWTAIYTRPTCL